MIEDILFSPTPLPSFVLQAPESSPGIPKLRAARKLMMDSNQSVMKSLEAAESYKSCLGLLKSTHACAGASWRILDFPPECTFCAEADFTMANLLCAALRLRTLGSEPDADARCVRLEEVLKAVRSSTVHTRGAWSPVYSNLLGSESMNSRCSLVELAIHAEYLVGAPAPTVGFEKLAGLWLSVHHKANEQVDVLNGCGDSKAAAAASEMATRALGRACESGAEFAFESRNFQKATSLGRFAATIREEFSERSRQFEAVSKSRNVPAMDLETTGAVLGTLPNPVELPKLYH